MPPDIRHPCAGRSQTQIRAFEALAVGQPPSCSTKTIDALLRAGLVYRVGERTVGRDSFGPIKLPVYEVPLIHHLAWCYWCAENIGDDDAT
jgi:hypothetical protein